MRQQTQSKPPKAKEWCAHIEQTVALKAGHAYTLRFWAADLVPSEYEPAFAVRHFGAPAAV
ncbi:MAG: hypothetical protein ABI895_25060 [Deltaproteobacteria bacterium]